MARRQIAAPMYADQLTQAPKSSFWTGSKGGFQNIPIYNQGQSGAFKDALELAVGLLKNPSQSPLAQQMRNQFYSQTVPALSERFTALGNGQRSSAFQNAIGSAGAQLDQNINAMGLQQALQLLQLGLTPQYQTAYNQGQQGFLQNSLKSLLGAGTSALTGGFLGGFIPGVGGAAGALSGLLGGQGGGQFLGSLFGGQ